VKKAEAERLAKAKGAKKGKKNVEKPADRVF
jgi:hypothetical protein